MEHVGIKNEHSVFRIVIIFLFSLSAFFTFVFWLLVSGDLYADSMARYGKEVQATITKVGYIDETDDDNSHYSYWQTYYEYVDDDGRKYTGEAYSFESKSKADEYIGKTVRVVINPKTGKSEIGSLEYFRKKSEGYRNHFIHAIVFSSLLAVVAEPFFNRVVAHTIRSKRIVNNLKSRYVDRGTIYGEVTKTFGLIWYYVKVQFTDEYGITHEKWAGDWFTRKEAKFLDEKKYVSIVPYKGSYGIMEEMPTAKKSKRV